MTKGINLGDIFNALIGENKVPNIHTQVHIEGQDVKYGKFNGIVQAGVTKKDGKMEMSVIHAMPQDPALLMLTLSSIVQATAVALLSNPLLDTEETVDLLHTAFDKGMTEGIMTHLKNEHPEKAAHIDQLNELMSMVGALKGMMK